jgi:glutathione S-transferase
MITLYHAPQSRSSRFIWLLEEIGTPYEIVYCSIRRQITNSGEPDPKNPNLTGKVPYLDHDGVQFGESTAIAIYLADRFPSAGLAPALDSPARGPYLEWMAYYTGELEPMMFAIWRNDTSPPALRQKEQVFAKMSKQLTDHTYIAGDAFTAADILYASAFSWAAEWLPQGPSIDAYKARINARPAVAHAHAKDSAPT